MSQKSCTRSIETRSMEFGYSPKRRPCNNLASEPRPCKTLPSLEPRSYEKWPSSESQLYENNSESRPYEHQSSDRQKPSDTISSDIEFEMLGVKMRKKHLINEGKFYKKWLVRCQGSDLIMKVFKKGEEDYCNRETDIYRLGISFDHVLGFFKQATLNDGIKVCLTYHCSNGPLRNYLQNGRFSSTELNKLIQSATRGVNFLHSRVTGWPPRPPIVHRNITSENFVVNENGECAICDFEAALQKENNLNLKVDLRACTPRYAPPEVLFETVRSFREFQKADVYSLGLVLWEICSRSIEVGLEYSLPFGNIFTGDPTISDMQQFFRGELKIYEQLEPIGLEERAFFLSDVLESCIQRSSALRPSALTVLKAVQSWPPVI